MVTLESRVKRDGTKASTLHDNAITKNDLLSLNSNSFKDCGLNDCTEGYIDFEDYLKNQPKPYPIIINEGRYCTYKRNLDSIRNAAWRIFLSHSLNEKCWRIFR